MEIQPIHAFPKTNETLPNSLDPNQTPQKAASDLGLHCSHKTLVLLKN